MWYSAVSLYRYDISTLKQKTTINAKNSVSYNFNNGIETCKLYKISVPANGYIKFQMSDKSSSISIYKTIYKKKSIFDLDSMVYISDTKTSYRVLPKGTYYLRVGTDNNTVKLKWTFVKSKNPTNYCRAKAVTLAKGKKKTVVFNYKHEYARWYKVKLTRKKTITITSKWLDNDYTSSAYITVFNSRGFSISTSSLTDTSERTQVLPKGTYYIRVSYDDSYYDSYVRRICRFSWK